MANPQCKYGYTRIANEILEALIRADLSGQELRITLFVIRKTYGFNKKDDFISLSQMAKALGCSQRRCGHVVQNLERMKILTVYENIQGVGKSYRFNKDYSQWNTVYENIHPVRKHTQGMYENIHHKRNNTKEIFLSDSIEVGLSEKLLSLIKQRNSNFRKPDLQKWAGHINKMIRIDKRSSEDIEKVIQWCQADSFWQNNVLSTEKLRKQYDALYMKAFSGNGKQIPERQRYY